MQSEPETPVKSTNRMLAVQQTGLQAVGSRMLGCQSQVQTQYGHCPKSSVAICIPRHTPSHAADPPARPASEPHAQDADMLLWHCTQAPLFGNTPCMRGSSTPWFSSPGLERKASWWRCLPTSSRGGLGGSR